MPYITDTELEELNKLRSIYKRNGIWQSADAIETLEQDVDEPIKVCVMALALLGCEPLWSCCGFDYKGQPIHKSHQYGRCYFVLGNRLSVLGIYVKLLYSDIPNKGFWSLQSAGDKSIDLHADVSNVIKQWDTPDSIHYYETLSMHIQEFENFLMGLHESFLDEVTLTDTNATFKDSIRSWQYPPKKDGVIRKSDLLG